MRAAIVLLLVLAAAACSAERGDGSYGMGVTAPAGQVAPLDPARNIAEQDCAKPVTLEGGNLLCR